MKRMVQRAPLIASLAMVFTPAVALIVGTFTLHQSTWDKDFTVALVNSFELALVVAVVSTVGGFILGSFAAIWRLGKLAMLLLLLALLIPEVPAAFAMREVFDIVGFSSSSLLRVAVGQIWFPTGLGCLLTWARLHGLRTGSLLDVGAVLGAGLRLKGELTVRLAGPAIVVSFLTAFALSLQDPVFPLFLASPDFAVLPNLIWAHARFGLQAWMLIYSSAVFLIGTIAASTLSTTEVSNEAL